MSDRTVQILDPETQKTIDLPVKTGTLGAPTIEIAGLSKALGYYTYDPGFGGTASCESTITYIDGDKGTLLYRGYSIEDLARNSSFLEVAYLLLYGDLPSARELSCFEGDVQQHTMVHEAVRHFISGFHYDAHPMAMLIGVVGSLAGFYHDSLDMNNPSDRNLSAIRMIAKVPTIAAMAYRHSIGWPIVYPKNSLDYSSGLLDMMFSVPSEAYQVNPVAAKALNLLFILHADHEQNASTSTVRLVGSTGANPYACVSAGIAALWGPAHGGANEAVLKMLSEIGHVGRVQEFIERAKDKNDPFRLMGFGHRVYKNYDPRATIIREMCHEVLEDLGVDDPMLDLAMELERIALEDEYFVERKLYPNVDFYSGIIYRALKIPTNMFTAMFAIARTSGWVAHWLEQHETPDARIGRPRQVYSGEPLRPYVPMSER